MLKTGEVLIMLIMLIMLISFLLYFQKMAKTGEMLIMLIIWGHMGPPPQGGSPQEKGNLINISPVLSTFSPRYA